MDAASRCVLTKLAMMSLMKRSLCLNSFVSLVEWERPSRFRSDDDLLETTISASFVVKRLKRTARAYIYLTKMEKLNVRPELAEQP